MPTGIDPKLLDTLAANAEKRWALPADCYSTLR